MKGESNRSYADHVNASTNVLLRVAAVLALPSILCLHKEMGKRFVGNDILLAFLTIFLWPAIAPPGDPRPMFVFLIFVVFMGVVSRRSVIRREKRGELTHRYYNGYPRLLRFFPRVDEIKFKAQHEPLIVCMAGFFCLPFSVSLGSFLLASGFSLGVSMAAIEAAEREQTDALHDQWIEQQYLAERFRRVRGK